MRIHLVFGVSFSVFCLTDHGLVTLVASKHQNLNTKH